MQITTGSLNMFRKPKHNKNREIKAAMANVTGRSNGHDSKHFNKHFFYVLLACLLALFTAQGLWAASITITWDRNQEPDIAGYKVYWGTASGSYSDSATINDTATDPPTATYTIDGLDVGTTYYFAIKAFDLAGQESIYSDEASIDIPGEGPGGEVSWDDWYETQDMVEIGEVSVRHQWKTVQLSGLRQFQHPVVIAGPPTRNGSHPCVVRIRNVTSNSFEIRLQEWLYLDETHKYENVSWMVVEAGTHVMPDGSIWQAGTFSLDGTLKWKSVTFEDSFNDTPVVFTSSQTFNGPDTLTVREKNISASGFSAAIQEEEARKNSGHATETIGYLAVSTTTELALHQILCKNIFVTVASGYDTKVAVEEEKSKDSETNHINETVGVLFLNDQVFANMQTFNGSDTASMRRK